MIIYIVHHDLAFEHGTVIAVRLELKQAKSDVEALLKAHADYEEDDLTIEEWDTDKNELLEAYQSIQGLWDTLSNHQKRIIKKLGIT